MLATARFYNTPDTVHFTIVLYSNTVRIWIWRIFCHCNI